MAEELNHISIPTADQIRKAIELYLVEAYPDRPPESVKTLLPPGTFDPGEFLMSDSLERTPDTSVLRDVRSFALRLGNGEYRHMKLRISRPPRGAVYLFVVDSHDEFLKAPPGSPDREVLEGLKRHNAHVARAIGTAWDAAGLPTEKNYLRRKVREARRKNFRRRSTDR